MGKRELSCLLLFTCNYVVSVWRGFLFLLVLGIGYVILLWHPLSLPYNYCSVRLYVLVNNVHCQLVVQITNMAIRIQHGFRLVHLYVHYIIIKTSETGYSAPGLNK